jgi:N-acylneuraminate cytidylyltransferase
LVRDLMAAAKPRIVALIPARSGSKRVPHKNIRLLAGHPLIAYSIRSAIDSGIFDAVICSTDDEDYAEVARHYGAEVPFLRPAQFAGEKSPDIEWVEDALKRLRDAGRDFDAFSILRPTSPFRHAGTLRRAWQEFIAAEGVDSLRAVEKCRQHPGKMWVVRQGRMLPLLPLGPEQQPRHSSQYAALPEVYVQNASLEIAWCSVVTQGRTIAGSTVLPFFTDAVEGLDVNEEFDWWKAERLLASGEAALPPVDLPCFPKLAATAKK